MSENSFKTIRCELDGNGIALVTLNQPKTLNALSTEMCSELTDCLKALDASDSCRAIVLAGEGRAFCSGLDLNEMKEGYGGTVGFYRTVEAANLLIALVTELTKPVVSAVDGLATASGMNLVLASDLAVATRESRFSQSFTNAGLVPDVGGTYLLPKIVGTSKAKEIIFMDRTISADEALRLGIIHQLAETEQVINAAKAMARKMASVPKFTFSVTKKMLNKCEDMDLHTALHIESLSQTMIASTEEHKAAVEAFFAKHAKKK